MYHFKFVKKRDVFLRSFQNTVLFVEKDLRTHKEILSLHINVTNITGLLIRRLID